MNIIMNITYTILEDELRDIILHEHMSMTSQQETSNG